MPAVVSSCISVEAIPEVRVLHFLPGSPERFKPDCAAKIDGGYCQANCQMLRRNASLSSKANLRKDEVGTQRIFEQSANQGCVQQPII
jgi:hypothetical protein